MKIKHIKASDLVKNNWSGGSTTQLVIYPENSEYKKLNFDFRISTARIEIEESVFTVLPNVSRKLMILDGEITIKHSNHYSKILKKFDQVNFSGDWETKSLGKATDFNLMTRGRAVGEIEAISVNKSKNINLHSEIDFYGLYIYKGDIKVNMNHKQINASQGDFLLISTEDCTKLEIITEIECNLILCKIKN